ncbi:MAG: porin [Planctomycetota bacterium]|jgi:hypothetical protein
MKRLVAATTVAVLGVALVGFSTRAADVSPFQLEAELMYEDSSEGDVIETSVIGVGATYAFRSIDPGSAPIEEAHFLSREPYAGLGIGFISGDSTLFIPADLSGTQLIIGAGYADKEVPVAVDFEFFTVGVDVEAPGVEGEMENSGMDLMVSCFVMPNLAVGLTYETSDMEVTIAGMGTLMESDQSGIGVAAKWVQELGTNGSAVNVEFGYSGVTAESPGSPDEDASIIEIGADYYFNQLVGVGFGLELLSADAADDDATTFGLRASYNAGSKVGVRLAWEKTSYDAAGAEDDDELTISVVGRF